MTTPDFAAGAGLARAKALAALTTGASQGWIAACSAAVAAHDREALDRLRSRDSPELAALVAGGHPIPLRQGEGLGSYDPTATLESRSAIAIVDVALALVDPTDASHRERALAGFLAAGVRSVGTVDPKSFTVEHPSAGFVALLARHLSGAVPNQVGATAEVPVLFDQTVGDLGASAYLRISRLADGPPGLHPDPRTMSFLTHDDEFASSLRDACAISAVQSRPVCLVWSLVDNEQSVLHVAGASLGAAFAVVLDDFAPVSRVRRLLRRRTLDPSWAVTGRLDGARLAAVSGYPAKLAAADRRSWRVIVPEESRSAVLTEAARFNVEITGAAKVGDAVRIARTRFNRRFALAAVLMGVLVLGLGGGIAGAAIASRAAITAEENRRIAVQLAADAPDLQATDPRLAALSALASYRLNPSSASTTALLQVAAGNSTTVAAVTAHEGEVLAQQATASTIITAGSERTIATWSIDGLQELDRVETERPVHLLAVAPTYRAVVANTADGFTVYSLSASGELTVRSRIAAEDALGDDMMAVLFPAGGDRFQAYWSSGLVQTWDFDGELMGTVDVTELGEVVADGLVPVFISIAPGPARESANGSQSRAAVWLVCNNGSIYEYDALGATLTLAVSAEELPAAPTAVASTGEFVAIGTEAGIVLWQGEEQRIIAFPYGGLNGSVHQLSWAAESTQLAAVSGGAIAADKLSIIPRGDAQFGASPGEVSAAGLGTGVTAIDGTSNFAVGHANGRLTIEDYQANRTGKPAAAGSNISTFGPEGELYLTVATSTSNFINYLRSVDISEQVEGSYPTIMDYDPSEWFGFDSFYVNDAAASQKYLAASGLAPDRHGTVVVWDRDTGEPLAKLGFVDDSSDAPVAIVSSVLIYEEAGTIVGFNLQTGELGFWSTDDWGVIAYKKIGGGMGGMEPSLDGTAVVVVTWPEQDTEGGDHELVAYDVRTGLELWRQPVGTQRRLSINPIDGRIAGLTDDGKIVVRSADARTVLIEAATPVQGSSIEWSTDGTRLAMLTAPGTTYVFDPETLALALPPLEAVDGRNAAGLAWSPDDSVIAVTTLYNENNRVYNGSTLLLTPDAESWTDQMCAIAGTGFTPAEWKRYVGESIPFRELCPR